VSSPSVVRRPRVDGRLHPGTPHLDEALAQVRRHRPEQLRALAGWLAVPSVSGDPRRRGDVLRAGTVLAGLLQAAGATVRRVPVPGAPPLVVGRAGGPPGSDTVLLYGHYDVVAPGPGWRIPAFRPVLGEGRLVGRGANDDKGQLMTAVAALDAWRRAGGPPASVWIVAEGAEEVGSPGLAEGLAALTRAVRPDLVLVCDTERAADGVPSVTVSQRGHLDLALRIDTGGAPVHPGRLGGAVVDPAVVLSQVIVRLTAVLAEQGRRSARDAGHPLLRERTDRQVASTAGSRATAGQGLDRRITELPALSVLRLTADAGTRAVPVRASALLDVRLPPSADPASALRQLVRTAREAAPPGVRVTLSAGAAHAGHAALPAPSHLAAVDVACRAAFGSPVRLVRSGGSLPAAGLLASAFPGTPVLLGLGTPGGRAHGPDEFLDLAGWTNGVALLVRLLASPDLRAPPVRRLPTLSLRPSLVTRRHRPSGSSIGPPSS
jgi:acetylornithine deacetylase/succinyl-diaminopimelate desuccinylase-like protein